MAQPTNPNTGSPTAGDERRRVELQETLLLTDVPEAAAMIPEQPAPVEATSNLSPATLAALSQRYEILAEAGTEAWATCTRRATARRARSSL
jgi:hypothetical protein